MFPVPTIDCPLLLICLLHAFSYFKSIRVLTYSQRLSKNLGLTLNLTSSSNHLSAWAILCAQLVKSDLPSQKTILGNM